MKILRFLLVLIALLLQVLSAAAGENKPGRLSGVLAHRDGRPLEYGMIYLFNSSAGPPPIMDRYWRVPDEISELDENGRFDLELAAGTYYIAYIKHADPYDVGPPKKGEIILVSRDSKGQPVPYTLKAGEMRDLGKLAEALPFDPAMARGGGKDLTAIEGRIVGEDGKPIVGAAVFAFTTPAKIGRPLFTSERSDSDGKFLLRVHQGGTYYLKVRGKHGGGQPGQDSVLDGEMNEKLAAVTVATGEIARGVIHKALTLRGPKSKRRLLEGAKTAPATENTTDLQK